MVCSDETEDWLKIEELLSAALELAPGERRQFLDTKTVGSPDLRREVESLLVCDERANGFLGAPALALAADFFPDAAEERASGDVGHYRIMREVGRGGMGAVYLAERADGEFTQQVALKVVRRSLADTELARRFRHERQILASLNHEHIARLIDGGLSETASRTSSWSMSRARALTTTAPRAGLDPRPAATLPRRL